MSNRCLLTMVFAFACFSRALAADDKAAEARNVKREVIEVFRGIYQAPPAADAAPAEKPTDDDDVLNPAERQMFEQFKPMLDLELAFARQVCGLDQDQQKLLATEGEAELKKIAKAYLKTQNQPRRVVRVNGVQRIEPAPVNPRKQLQEFFVSTVKAKLPADKAELYLAEVAQRAEFHKRVAVENMVAILDDRLMLDAAQREKLAKSLSANWDENWVLLEALANADQSLPAIPNKHIVPHLRPSQKMMWQAISQGQGNQQIFFGGGGF